MHCNVLGLALIAYQPPESTLALGELSIIDLWSQALQETRYLFYSEFRSVIIGPGRPPVAGPPRK